MSVDGSGSISLGEFNEAAGTRRAAGRTKRRIRGRWRPPGPAPCRSGPAASRDWTASATVGSTRWRPTGLAPASGSSCGTPRPVRRRRRRPTSRLRCSCRWRRGAGRSAIATGCRLMGFARATLVLSITPGRLDGFVSPFILIGRTKQKTRTSRKDEQAVSTSLWLTEL